MEDRDPSKDPELTHHYIGHALVKGRFAIELGRTIEDSRKYLLSKLMALDETGSKPHYKLSRRVLDYLDKSGEWKTSEDVENFATEYDKLEKELIGPNSVKEFGEKHFPK